MLIVVVLVLGVCAIFTREHSINQSKRKKALFTVIQIALNIMAFSTIVKETTSAFTQNTTTKVVCIIAIVLYCTGVALQICIAHDEISKFK